MPSIGFNNPISGSYGAFNLFAADPKSPGGAIRGYMPNPIEKVNREYPEFEHIRFTLKQAWNTKYPHQLKVANKKAIITPFRAVNNAGDLLSREYYSCGGPCQSFQSRPGLRGLKTHFGSISDSCVPGVVYSTYQLDPRIPAAACNTKWVYDSSDYVTYLKQKAINKNYNDLSYAGNKYSGSQSAYRAARRY
jgi:hypothetical protein